MGFREPIAFLLGLEGAALLRADAGDDLGDTFVAERISEIRALLDAYDRGDLDRGWPIGAIDTVGGYRIWAETYDDPGNPLIEVEEPIVQEILGGLPVGRALDAACGTGRHGRFLAARGHDVIGVDSSPEMLERARVNCAAADFKLGELQALPLPDAAVDLVVCALALPHQPALEPVFGEFARVLRPGGHLVLSDIHVDSLYFGGIAGVPSADGGIARMPASRWLPSDYLTAAVPLGLRVLRCLEPRWPASDTAGGPGVRQWVGAAVDSVYEAVPAAIIWQFRRTSD